MKTTTKTVYVVQERRAGRAWRDLSDSYQSASYARTQRDDLKRHHPEGQFRVVKRTITTTEEVVE